MLQEHAGVPTVAWFSPSGCAHVHVCFSRYEVLDMSAGETEMRIRTGNRAKHLTEGDEQLFERHDRTLVSLCSLDSCSSVHLNDIYQWTNQDCGICYARKIILLKERAAHDKGIGEDLNCLNHTGVLKMGLSSPFWRSPKGIYHPSWCLLIQISADLA